MRGVGLLKLSKCISEWRMFQCLIWINKVKVSVVVRCVPCKHDCERVKVIVFWGDISHVVKCVPISYRLIVLGDSNDTASLDPEICFMGEFDMQDVKNNGRRLLNVTKKYGSHLKYRFEWIKRIIKKK